MVARSYDIYLEFIVFGRFCNDFWNGDKICWSGIGVVFGINVIIAIFGSAAPSSPYVISSDCHACANKLGAALSFSCNSAENLLYCKKRQQSTPPFLCFSFRVIFRVDSDVLALRQSLCSSRRDNGAKVQGWRCCGGLLREVDFVGTHHCGILGLFGCPDHRSFSTLPKNRPK